MISLLKPLAPGLDEPLELLDACHGRVDAQLETLVRLHHWLLEHGADSEARQAAQGVLRYFDVAAPKHHADEEQDLFPRLLLRERAQGGSELEPTLNALVHEHGYLSALWRELREPLQAVQQGSASTLPVELLERFERTYRGHMATEEGVVFAASHRLLTQEDLAEMSRHMSARRGAKQ